MFQLIIIDKKKRDHENDNMAINNKRNKHTFR